MTTRNVRKKILHALHFKLKKLIKYFTSHINKCQTYFWVECITQKMNVNVNCMTIDIYIYDLVRFLFRWKNRPPPPKKKKKKKKNTYK